MAQAEHRHEQTLQLRAIWVTASDATQFRGDVGDGAYDTQLVYEAVVQRGVIPIVPPRKNAHIRKEASFAYRNDGIGACR